MPKYTTNILIEVADETVTEIEDLREKLKSAALRKEPTISLNFTPTLTNEEKLEARRISREHGIDSANIWLKDLCRKKKKEYMEHRREVTRSWSSRRALIIRLIEVGLKHVDEV